MQKSSIYPVQGEHISSAAGFTPVSYTHLDVYKRQIYDMIALYHFALQATVIEFTGLEQFTDAFFDRQLDWLLRWGEQCEESERRDPCAKGVFDHSGTDRASAGQRA